VDSVLVGQDFLVSKIGYENILLVYFGEFWILYKNSISNTGVQGKNNANQNVNKVQNPGIYE
jgi:hypothetical protein